MQEVIRDFPPLDLAAVISLCSVSSRKDPDLVDLCMEQFDVQGSRHSLGARASALAAALVSTNHSEDVDGLMRLLEFQVPDASCCLTLPSTPGSLSPLPPLPGL